MYWLKEAAVRDEPNAQYELAIQLLDDINGEDDSSTNEAFRLLEKAAAKNHPDGNTFIHLVIIIIIIFNN